MVFARFTPDLTLHLPNTQTGIALLDHEFQAPFTAPAAVLTPRLHALDHFGSAHTVFAEQFGRPSTGPGGIVGRPPLPPISTSSDATIKPEKPDEEKTKQEIDDESALELTRLLVGVALEEAQGRIERKIGRADEHDAGELRGQLKKLQAAMTVAQTQLDSPVALANRDTRLRLIRAIFSYINDVPALKKRYATMVNPLARFLNIGTGAYISHVPAASLARSAQEAGVINLNRTPLEQFVGKSWEDICTLCGFNPREYQEAWYQGALMRATQGFDRGYVGAPTQTGKTFFSFPLAVALAMACYPGKTILFVVKEKNVKGDIIDGIRTAVPGIKLGIIDADNKDFGSGYFVVVASLMTVSREEHLTNLKPENYGVVATDEAISLFTASGKTVITHLGFRNTDGTITPLEERFLFGMSADAGMYSFSPIFGANARLDEMDLPWYINKAHLHEPIGLERSYRDVASDDWEVTTVNGETYAYPKKKRKAIADIYRDWIEIFGRDAKIIVPWTRIADTIAAEAYFNMMEGKVVSYAYHSQRSGDENRTIEKSFQNGTGPRVIHATRGLAVGFRAKKAQGIIFPFQTDSARLYGQWVGRLLGIHDNEPQRQVRVVQKTGWNGGRNKKTAMTLARLLGASDFHPADGVEYRPLKEIIGSGIKSPELPPKFEVHFVDGNITKPEFIGVADGASIVCYPKRFPAKFKEALDTKFKGDVNTMALALKLTPQDIDHFLTGQMPKEFHDVRHMAKVLAPDNSAAFINAWIEDFLELMAVRFPMNEWNQDSAVRELSRILRRQSLMADYDEDGAAFASGLFLASHETKDLGQLLHGEYLDNVGFVAIDWRGLAQKIIAAARELDDELITDLLDRVAEEIRIEAAARLEREDQRQERERKKQERLTQNLVADETKPAKSPTAAATQGAPVVIKEEFFPNDGEMSVGRKLLLYTRLNQSINSLETNKVILKELNCFGTLGQLVLTPLDWLKELETLKVRNRLESLQDALAKLDLSIGMNVRGWDAMTIMPPEDAPAIYALFDKPITELELSETIETKFRENNIKFIGDVERKKGRNFQVSFLSDDEQKCFEAALWKKFELSFKINIYIYGWKSPEERAQLELKQAAERAARDLLRQKADELGISIAAYVAIYDSYSKVLYKRVDELNISVRAAKCLQNAGIEYIWQLVEKSGAELLRMKNLGRKSIFEIKDLLTEYGLSLGMKLTNFHRKEVFAEPELATQDVIDAIAIYTTENSETSYSENLYKRVDELNISVRAAKCLQNAGIEYIWQLVEKSEAELLKIKNLGRKSFFEIKDLLTEYGLSLGMKLINFPKNRG